LVDLGHLRRSNKNWRDGNVHVFGKHGGVAMDCGLAICGVRLLPVHDRAQLSLKQYGARRFVAESQVMSDGVSEFDADTPSLAGSDRDF